MTTGLIRARLSRFFQKILAAVLLSAAILLTWRGRIISPASGQRCGMFSIAMARLKICRSPPNVAGLPRRIRRQVLSAKRDLRISSGAIAPKRRIISMLFDMLKAVAGCGIAVFFVRYWIEEGPPPLLRRPKRKRL